MGLPQPSVAPGCTATCAASSNAARCSLCSATPNLMLPHWSWQIRPELHFTAGLLLLLLASAATAMLPLPHAASPAPEPAHLGNIGTARVQHVQHLQVQQRWAWAAAISATSSHAVPRLLRVLLGHASAAQSAFSGTHELLAAQQPVGHKLAGAQSGRHLARHTGCERRDQGVSGAQVAACCMLCPFAPGPPKRARCVLPRPIMRGK